MISDKPIPGVVTDARPHPPGEKGAKLSLKEVAERAWKARMSPWLRSWALQTIANAGVSTGGRRQKATAILEEFRKKVPYVNDPVMGEFMATPDQLLCLNEAICMPGGDCDEAAITLAAAMLTINIPAMIVGSSHKSPAKTPTHVFMAFEDDGGEWVRMDGTTKHPVGKAPPRLREWWVEPGEEAKEKGEGDFVGMSGVKDGAGTLSGLISMSDLLYPGIR